MNEDDTTVQDVQDTGAEALPASQDAPQSAEVETTTEPSEPQPDANEETQSAPEVDDKLKKYAESNGFELDSPGAIKAAEIALKQQQQATKNYHKSQELEKATGITDEQVPADATQQQQENIRLRNLELQLSVQSWKSSNPEKAALESDMVKVLEDPKKLTLVQEGYLSLDDVYSLAKANAPDNSAQLKSEGGQEALQRLAQKQTAAVPRGSATTTSAPKEKAFEELSIDEMEAKLGFASR